jgi:hypothetical protein
MRVALVLCVHCKANSTSETLGRVLPLNGAIERLDAQAYQLTSEALSRWTLDRWSANLSPRHTTELPPFQRVCTRTWPSVLDNEPYFAAFVTSSWKRRSRCRAFSGSISKFGPRT